MALQCQWNHPATSALSRWQSPFHKTRPRRGQCTTLHTDRQGQVPLGDLPQQPADEGRLVAGKAALVLEEADQLGQVLGPPEQPDLEGVAGGTPDLMILPVPEEFQQERRAVQGGEELDSDHPLRGVGRFADAGEDVVDHLAGAAELDVPVE